jgi:Ca2+-binding RTX toxin-like protein
LTICSDATKTKGASLSSAAQCVDTDGDPVLGEADHLVNVHLLAGSGADTLKGDIGNDTLEGGVGKNCEL